MGHQSITLGVGAYGQAALMVLNADGTPALALAITDARVTNNGELRLEATLTLPDGQYAVRADAAAAAGVDEDFLQFHANRYAEQVVTHISPNASGAFRDLRKGNTGNSGGGGNGGGGKHGGHGNQSSGRWPKPERRQGGRPNQSGHRW